MILFLLLFLCCVARSLCSGTSGLLPTKSYIVGQVIFKKKKISELNSGAAIKSVCRGKEGWVRLDVKSR